MSLINEALKKAQKQRTGETPPLPAVGGESAARIARRGQPAGFNTLILRVGLGVGALAAVIVGAVLLLRRPAPAPTFAPLPSASSAITPASLSKPAEVPLASVPATPPEPPTVVAPNSAPVYATPVATATPGLASVELPKPVDTATVQLAPEPSKPVAPATFRKLEPRAINFINSIRVAGIRASASDSKVLMNDRVYRLGDTVEAEMGLKLAGITASSLTFEDENGGRYTRNF